MAEMNPNPASASPATGARSSRRLDLWLFVLMLALALIGVGITELRETGGRLYWLTLVLVYGFISLVRSWPRAGGRGRGVWPHIRAQVFHWMGALVAIYIVLLFEGVDIDSRGAAADHSLLILALSCYLAGVHFNWTYLPLGALLAVMSVGLGFLDQFSLFTLLVPLAILAIWLILRRTRDVLSHS